MSESLVGHDMIIETMATTSNDHIRDHVDELKHMQYHYITSYLSKLSLKVFEVRGRYNARTSSLTR